MSQPVRESLTHHNYQDQIDQQLVRLMDRVNLHSGKIPVPDDIGKENNYAAILKFAQKQGIPRPVKIEYNSQEMCYYVSRGQ